jgi:[ribulose-bisphosphate carboxylase]/[fructose-bisphosphate aldolase]-lysine N-methyltransferase
MSAKWSIKSAGLFSGGRTLAIEAERALKDGDKIAMDFAGGRTAGQVLLDFGVFGGGGGAGDVGTFALTVALPDDDRFFDDKLDILELHGLQASNEFVLAAGAPPPAGLLATLRLLNLQGADAFLLEALFRNEAWDHMQLPVSQENELAVCKSMSDGCAAALAGLPGSAEDDAAALRAAAPGSRAAIAAAVRLGERQALEGAAAYFGARLERLADMEYYAERRLKRLGLLDKEGRPTDWESFFDEGIA